LDKYEKNARYKELMGKMKRAYSNSFFYEQIFLEYSILEDRTESLLRHAQYSVLNYEGKELTLHSKLIKIKKSTAFKEKYINKHINEELIDKTIIWKNKRNKLIHNLVNCSYTNDDICSIASEGYELIKIWNNKSKLVNHFFDKGGK